MWSFDDVITWDIPVGVNFANVPASTELMLVNCMPSERIGGNATGIAKIKRLDWYTHATGTHTTAASISLRDYPITHNLGKIPKKIFCTVMNTDTNAILPYTLPEDLVTTTTFKVRFPRAPPLANVSGGQNLKFSWMVMV